MKLASITLQNFRGYKDPTTIKIEKGLTALVGRNDAGKSPVLEAIALFLEAPGSKIDFSDCCVSDESKQVRIICTFEPGTAELVLDDEHATTLAAENLLNDDGLLEIHKRWDMSGPKISSETIIVCSVPECGFGNLLEFEQKDLQKLAKDRELVIDDARINSRLRSALWASEPNSVRKRTELPTRKGKPKLLLEKIEKALPGCALFRSDRKSEDSDPEAQSPLMVAVQQANSESAASLASLAKDVEVRVQDVTTRTLEKLAEMSPDIARELRPSFAPPAWHKAFSVALTTDSGVAMNKRGSGVRRLLLLSFFRAEAERRWAAEGQTNYIYLIEEPETSQHPANQVMLVDALQELSSSGTRQVVITTHTPALAERLDASGIRHVARGDAVVVRQGADVLEEIAEALGVHPDHRVKVFICLEGPNDIAFLQNICAVLRIDDPSLPDLSDSSRYLLFPLGGETLRHWVERNLLKELGRPEFYLFDRDDDEKYKDVVAGLSKDSRKIAQLTSRRTIENYLHIDAVRAALQDKKSHLAVWALSSDLQIEADTDVCQELANRSGVKPAAWKAFLNNEATKRMTTALLQQSGAHAEIVGWLRGIEELARQQEQRERGRSSKQLSFNYE